MKRVNSIMASHQMLSSLVMHGLFEVMPIRGRGQEGPPTQHKTAQRKMARATGKRSSEEEKEGEQHR